MEECIEKCLSGRYVLKKIIAVGEKSISYKAYDNLEDRTVTIKVFKGEVFSKAERGSRLKRKLNALTLFSFPGIVQVYDYEFDGPQKYIVMEYVDGRSLKDYLDEHKRLNWKDALNVEAQVLMALEYAHQRGIIHQNMKPENVLLADDGTIKVTDFKITGLMDSQNETVTDSNRDFFSYLNPEQGRSNTADENSDIYAVGAILFKMLTGYTPLDEDSAVSAMQHWGHSKRLSKTDDKIPAGIKEIVIRAIQKNPELRYQSVSDMLSDIKKLQLNPDITFNYDFGGNSKKKNCRGWIQRAFKVRTAPVVIGVLIPIIMAVVIAAILMSIGRNILVSSKVKVPNLVGQKYTNVKANPKYKSIDIKMLTTEYSNTYPAGTIISQKPLPETLVDEGTTVNVFVSLGPEKLVLPDVTGMKEADAVSALNDAGFKKVKISMIYDNLTEASYTVRLEPSVNSQVSADTDITVYVSMGADPKKLLTVPKLSGMSYEAAIHKLEALGLKAGTKTYRSSGLEANTVISQSPAANSRVAVNTRVNLVISSGKKTAAGSSTSSTGAADGGNDKHTYNFKWRINWNSFLPKKFISGHTH